MTDVPTFQEPAYRHHPGVTPRPVGGPVAEISSAVSRETALDDPVVQRALRYGLFLIDLRYFWEAHEVWEPVWLACPPNGRARLLLRALIQAANAHLKREMNRPRAVVRLARDARQVLAELHAADGEAFMGVVVSRLSADLEALAIPTDDVKG